MEQNGPDPIMVDEDNFNYRTVEDDYEEINVVYLVTDDIFIDICGHVLQGMEGYLGRDNIDMMHIEIYDNHPGWNDHYYILNEDAHAVYRIYAINYGYKHWENGLV